MLKLTESLQINDLQGFLFGSISKYSLEIKTLVSD